MHSHALAAVVDAGQNVCMKIDHSFLTMRRDADSRSLAASVKNHHISSLEYDLQVKPKALFPNVFYVQIDPLVERERISVFLDLPKAQKPAFAKTAIVAKHSN